MTDSEYEIHEAAPIDAEGHPVHPEKGHRICGARKSPRSTPAPHGRSRDDYAYCLLAAGWGTESSLGACKNHPYAGSQIGESNPSYESGAYSKYLSSANFTDDELERADAVFSDLGDPEARDDVFRSLIVDLWTRYERTKDPRFSRELRQTMAEFGYTPEEARQLHVEHSGSIDHDHTLSDRQREHLDALTEGSVEVDVEAVENIE